MVTDFSQLYHNLLEDIGHCQRKRLDIKAELECCFQICNDYKSLLLKVAGTSKFECREEEIELYKKWKPLFLAEAEYFAYRYHAKLFTEDADIVANIQFFQRESTRLTKFIEDNRLFYEYWKSGDTELDETWFFPDKKGDDHCSHEQLAATLLALERYTVFIEEQLMDMKLVK